VAHGGYLLAGVTAIVASRQVQEEALAGVMFYLAAYGIMNACVFGGLILLPSRTPQPSDGPSGTSAETYEDLQGMGRHHVALGIAMAIGCFSLTGLPFTVGFFGKAFLILPALSSGESSMVILVIALVINAAISSGYYLKIVGTMFLRNDPSGPPSPAMAHDAGRPLPIQLAVTISAGLTIGLGVALPVVQKLTDRISEATHESGESVKPIASSEKPE